MGASSGGGSNGSGVVGTVEVNPDGVSVSAPAVPKVPGTPSWLTGEFYAAITPAVVAIVGAVTGGHVVPGTVERELVAFGTVAVMVYAVARTGLKAVHVHAAAKVATAEAMSAAAVARATSPASTGPDVSAIADSVAALLEQRFVLRHRPQPRRKQ